MTPEYLQNFVSWWVQICVIALIAAPLPKLFRIRHPRSHIVYCYIMLALWAALPLIEPWQTPVVSNKSGHLSGLPGGPRIPGSALRLPAVIDWDHILLVVLTAGIVVKLCWFFAGMWRIHHYRAAAIPLKNLPTPAISASARMNRNAMMCVSPDDTGPVTFGFRRPVILLPQSFLNLNETAQYAVVCHELLHVKRKDWVATVIEELVGAFLWFHPAVWWLLAQVRLAREQYVDAEVVRFTEARDSYIDALLAMAASPGTSGVARAPAFFGQGHLIQRMRFLLSEHHISTERLWLSYGVITGVLTAACLTVSTAFPLIGQSQVQDSAAEHEQSADESASPLAPQTKSVRHREASEHIFKVGNGVTEPKLIHYVEPQYSDLARQARIRGAVMLEGVVEADGTMTITRLARSLHPELDRNAVYAAKQWRFDPGKANGAPVPVQLDVEVSFSVE